MFCTVPCHWLNKSTNSSACHWLFSFFYFIFLDNFYLYQLIRKGFTIDSECLKEFLFFSLTVARFLLGAWPVLIDEFVEFAKPLVQGRQTSVWNCCWQLTQWSSFKMTSTTAGTTSGQMGYLQEHYDLSIVLSNICKINPHFINKYKYYK